MLSDTSKMYNALSPFVFFILQDVQKFENVYAASILFAFWKYFELLYVLSGLDDLERKTNIDWMSFIISLISVVSLGHFGFRGTICFLSMGIIFCRLILKRKNYSLHVELVLIVSTFSSLRLWSYCIWEIKIINEHD